MLTIRTILAAGSLAARLGSNAGAGTQATPPPPGSGPDAAPSLGRIGRWVPTTWPQYRTLALLLAGAIVGHLRWPLAHLAGGPLARLARVYGHAMAESGLDPDAVGDEGGSVGVLQYHSDNPTVPLDIRRSPYWSGYYQAKEVQEALLQDWRWWTMALPVVGYLVERYLWTHGSSAAAARAAWTGDSDGVTWWDQVRAEPIAWRAYSVAAVLAWGVPVVLGCVYADTIRRWWR